jgi:RND family efflux transporter MFP subunit
MKYILHFITAMTLLVSCSKKEAPAVVESIRPVRYEKVISTGMGINNTFSGTCQSDKEATMSFKVAGKVSTISVEVGDRVKKGAVIAVMDAVDYSITYDQAIDQLKGAKTKQESAETQRIANKSNYERVEKLYENNSVSVSEYEQAKAAYNVSVSQYEAAVSQVSTAMKQVEAAKNQVGYTRLTAPFDGIVTGVYIAENELVGSGSPIVSISAEGRPEVKVGIPETVIADIAKGQKVNIRFSTFPDENFVGRVKEVAYSSNNTSTFPVTIAIEKPSVKIRPGMAASVTFSNGAGHAARPVLVAPVKGIGQGPDGNFAFVIEQSGEHYTVKKTGVQVGELLPKGFEIKSGLKEGDMVATAGLKSLLDGLKVSLME